MMRAEFPPNPPSPSPPSLPNRLVSPLRCENEEEEVNPEGRPSTAKDDAVSACSSGYSSLCSSRKTSAASSVCSSRKSSSSSVCSSRKSSASSGSPDVLFLGDAMSVSDAVFAPQPNNNNNDNNVINNNEEADKVPPQSGGGEASLRAKPEASAEDLRLLKAMEEANR